MTAANEAQHNGSVQCRICEHNNAGTQMTKLPDNASERTIRRLRNSDQNQFSEM